MNNIELLTQKLLEITTKVQGGVTAHALDSINLVLNCIRVDGIHIILYGLLSLLIAWIPFKVMKNKLAKIKNYNAKQERNSDHKCWDDYPDIFVPCATISIVAAIVAAFLLVDIWSYVAIINPKLYLAHILIAK
jgi:hypothetical protein